MSHVATSDLGPETAFLKRAAAAAAEIVSEWFRKPLAVEEKDDLSPVTVADRAIEAKLRALIAHSFPQDGVFGEEEEPSNISSPRVWVLDPIDGTKSFVTGHPLFGLLLGLLEAGRPVLGQIDMPVLGERWQGARGKPSLFNGTICQTSGCQTLAQARLFTTDPFLFTAGAREAFDTLASKVRFTRFGGDCYNYGLLASGHCDLVVEIGLKPFDFLPLVPIIEGAGGTITDWQGRALDLHSTGHVVAAASGPLHAAVLEHLAHHAVAAAA